MGISIVQKSKLGGKPKSQCRAALVLAGGAISGGAFKVGGLIALNTLLTGRRVLDFDIYVGLSAGAFLAAPLSSGIGPEELLRSLNGHSSKIGKFQPWDFYWPNIDEFLGRPAKFIKDLVTFLPEIAITLARFIPEHRASLQELLLDYLRRPSSRTLERFLLPFIKEVMAQAELPYGSSYIPSGFFDGSRIETFIRHNLEKNNLPNNFRLLRLDRRKELYITATNLNTAQNVVFGHDEDNSATISQAVMASTAIPGFYRPARINGIDYVDGGVRKTANINVAVAKDADLVIVYNPFRPFFNFANRYSRRYRSIADMGVLAVLNQSFRTLLHSRLMYGMEYFRNDPSFNGDIILIEPTEEDQKFFDINPLAFWQRAISARHGFVSVRESIEKRYPLIKRILNHHGFDCDRDRLNRSFSLIERVPTDDEAIMDILEAQTPRPNRAAPLRLVK
ncbi:MAG: patatin-like phospholipase family protein [Myxococcales bacterium]|nr:patatin-like phospholipase family protein [Myxococcales bacterium]